MFLGRPRAAAWGVACVALLIAAPAAAQDIDASACVDAHTSAQKFRADGKLRAARQQLLLCAQQACPAIARNDCTSWLNEMDKEQPSIVFRAKRADGNDAVEVQVLMDGEKLADRLEGRAIGVDPGPHQFRFELAGHEPVDRQVVVIVGEKNRAITVEFEESAKGPGGPAAPEPQLDSSSGSGIPTATWIFGGVGVVGLAGFTYFGLKGLGDEEDLEACKPNCSDDAVSDVERTFLFGDISLVVGVAGLGAATYFLLTAGDEKTAPATTGMLLPIPGGAQASVVGRF
ncbi:MAG TPA: hypothetical protein PKA88_15460 [Polyangiaceae bacterium]|nr:hypothetical protein [Polyangiaceae bacterium]